MLWIRSTFIFLLTRDGAGGGGGGGGGIGTVGLPSKAVTTDLMLLAPAILWLGSTFTVLATRGDCGGGGDIGTVDLVSLKAITLSAPALL